MKAGIVFCVLVGYMASSALAYDFAGGTGEPNDPYQIATAEQLISIGDDWISQDKHFILTADIDLAGTTRTGAMIPSFSGVFDGNGHTISHLNCTTGERYGGLFGYILDPNVVIRDLGLIDPNIQENTIAGCLVGSLWEGTLIDCYVNDGHIQGNEVVGGLVGYNRTGTIINCSSTAMVFGNYTAGGLVGVNGGSILNGYAVARVSSKDGSAGGLVGRNGISHIDYDISGRITGCYSSGTVKGFQFVGGLVGSDSHSFNVDSYSTADVMGDKYVGGLIGLSTSSSIARCYAIGSVTGIQHTGGLLVSYNNSSTVIASFWDVETSGQTLSAGGLGLITAEMQDPNTYLNAGWDFVDEQTNGLHDFWQITEAEYPSLTTPIKLKGSGIPGDPYLIMNANELAAVWYRPMAYYQLIADIDLSGITWNMAVVPWFGGVFDGNSCMICNLQIEGISYLGLFGELTYGAMVSSLGLNAVDVNGTENYIGSLVGANRGGMIKSCYSTGVVSGNSVVGGLVGVNDDTWAPQDRAGNITLCYSAGTVNGDYFVGGLVGENSGIVTNSYSRGSIMGIRGVGGLVGVNYGGFNVLNTYSSSSVIGVNNVGGLVGDNYSGVTITNSFWDFEISGLTESVGGLTTIEMQTVNTYLDAGWDFDTIWSICEGQDYPRLQWEGIECE